MAEREVKRSRARSTGTVVVLDRREDGEGWETICEAHGGVCSHDTRKLAESFAAAPEEWCEDCQHGEGTLDGSRPVEGLPVAPEPEPRYIAEQMDGRPEDPFFTSRWSVIDTATGIVVASWRETPLSGLTEVEAAETAAAYNAETARSAS